MDWKILLVFSGFYKLRFSFEIVLFMCFSVGSVGEKSSQSHSNKFGIQLAFASPGKTGLD